MKQTSLLISLLISIPIYAADYYVALSGNDSNTGDIESPFKNLKTAIGKTTTGTTIYLREGTYKPEVSDIMKYGDEVYMTRMVVCLKSHS